MNYLIVSYAAVKSIITLKQSQSIEYEFGKTIPLFLKGEIDKYHFAGIYFRKLESGLLIYCDKGQGNKSLVFDLTTYKGFFDHREAESLTIFQKILRFSIRYWEKLPYTNCEKNVLGTTISMVFPFPFLAGGAYKVFVETSPDQKRMDKRSGNYLLIFKDGTGKNYNFEKISTTQFRKAISELNKQLITHKPDTTSSECKIDSLNAFSIGDRLHPTISSHIGFEKWRQYLTDKQKEFIFSERNGAERLEGAAGTGKTLSLVLKCIFLIKQAIKQDRSLDALFITHSISTKKNIIDIFQANFPEIINYYDRFSNPVSLTITTLQEFCIAHLDTGIDETEYLDRDAQESKEVQLLYLSEALNEVLSEDYQSYKDFMSTELCEFFENNDEWNIAELLQHEIAVLIKGRAQEDIERYRKLSRPKYGIRTKTEGDLNFLFLIFEVYRNKLTNVNQFDSDDIILTSIGQFNTPIWRRRRIRYGFDITFIDETHLFNFNELSIFHFINKEENKRDIVFSVDKTQAIGDRGLIDNSISNALNIEDEIGNKQLKFNTVFRSSPDIINLAFNVLSSGASLFTNFENPMEKVSSSFTNDEEKKSKKPVYIQCSNEQIVISNSFNCADRMSKDLDEPKSSILIVGCTDSILQKLEKHARNSNKPFEILKSRGDIKAVYKAISNGKFVLGGIDYIGGLEFSGVVIVGADKGHLPPVNSIEKNVDSFHFLNYASYNRLYVAITRAKYAVTFLGEKSRGVSDLLSSAISENIIDVIN